MRFVLPPVGLWTPSLDAVPTVQTRELAAEIEALGYGAIWVPEVAGRDVFVHLTHVLLATERLIAATGVANIWARDAVTMVGGAKALTEAFPERFLLGLGVSHQHLVQGLRGHNWDRPLAAMDAYLDALDAAPYRGFRPTTPVRRVLGALGPKMLQLSADKADGAHPFLVTPEYTADAREALGAEPLLCPLQLVLLETDPGRAREASRKMLSTYTTLPNYQANLRRLGYADDDFLDGGSDRLVDAMVAWGTVDAVVARVQAHLDAGADHVTVNTIAERFTVPVDQWRELAPAVRDLAGSRA